MAKKWDNRTSNLNSFTPEFVQDLAAERHEQSTEDATQPVPESAGITACALFDVLSNRRRWYVVYFFKHYTTIVELGTLSTQIAAWENDLSLSEVTGTERKRVYTSLQQVHLPKMDELGILEFDKRSGQIKAAPFVTDIQLDPSSSDEGNHALYRYYVALATAHGAFVVMLLAEIWPLASVPTSIEVATFAVSFALLVSLHVYSVD